MSFQTEIQTEIKKVIVKYVTFLSQKYKLDFDEMMQLWDSTSLERNEVKQSKKEEKIVDTELTVEKISKSTVPELKAFCRLKNLKLSGKKEEIVSRLLNFLNGRKESSSSTSLPPPPKTVSNMNVKEQKRNMVNEVSKKTSERNTEKIAIKKNKFGNFEHLSTKLVFNPKNETVIGTQNVNGTIDPLVDADIENCKQFNFKYTLPFNLDTKENINNIKVEDLDDIDGLEKVDDVEDDVEAEETIEEEEDEEVIEED